MLSYLSTDWFLHAFHSYKQQTSALDIAIENEQWNIVELLVTAGGIQGIDAASKVSGTAMLSF